MEYRPFLKNSFKNMVARPVCINIIRIDFTTITIHQTNNLVRSKKKAINLSFLIDKNLIGEL
jgi:hypothetical protein